MESVRAETSKALEQALEQAQAVSENREKEERDFFGVTRTRGAIYTLPRMKDDCRAVALSKDDRRTAVVLEGDEAPKVVSSRGRHDRSISCHKYTRARGEIYPRRRVN